MPPTDAHALGRPRIESASPPGHTILRVFYTRNPFYLLSVCFLLHGTRLWFQNDAGRHNPWPLMGLIAAYIVVLALTAFVIVRVGRVWDDARSIFLIVLMLFVEMSLCFDDVLILFPAVSTPLLIAGLLLAMSVSEGLLLGLRIRLPALYRVPFHLMLTLLFLYPLCLTSAIFAHDATALSWRIFLFSPAVALVLLTLLPAVRRGPRYVRHNGTPWNWPWFPGVMLGTVAAGLCVRAYAVSLSFDPVLSLGFKEAMQLQTAFGSYFLVPIFLAAGLLMMEAGVVSGNRLFVRMALWVPFVCVWLAIPAESPNLPYAEFLDLFMRRVGSPVWVTVIAAVAYSFYALLRKISGAEETLVTALVLASLTNAETVSLATFVSPQPLALCLIAVIELYWGLSKSDSRRTLLGAVCGIAVLHSVVSDGGASSGLQDVIALHLIGVATILVGMVFRDPFAHFLRNVGALLLIVACLFALAGPIEESATSWFLPVYCIVLMAVSFIYAYAFSNLLFFYGGLAMTALALGTFGWHTYTALKRAPEWQGIDSFLLALAFLGVATAISAVKAGISQRLIALFPKPRPPTNGPID